MEINNFVAAHGFGGNTERFLSSRGTATTAPTKAGATSNVPLS